MNFYYLTKQSLIFVAFFLLFIAGNLLAREARIEHPRASPHYGGAYGGGYHPQERAAARGYEAGEATGAGTASGGAVYPSQQPEVNVNVQQSPP